MYLSTPSPSQPNVVGAGLKITPLAWRLGANGFLAQSFKVAPLLIGFQQTTVQSLLEKAGVVVNGTSQLLRGDAEGAAGNAATITQEIWTSIKGLPTVVRACTIVALHQSRAHSPCGRLRRASW